MHDEARQNAVPRSYLRPGWERAQRFPPLFPLDLRPPREASPPLRPAMRASSLVNSCAVPFWCAARPPLAAIARCAWGSIAANPRGVFLLTAPLSLLPLSRPPSLPRSFPARPGSLMLARPPADAPLRSSMKSPLLLDWSAISQSPAAMIFSVAVAASRRNRRSAVRRRGESGGVEYI